VLPFDPEPTLLKEDELDEYDDIEEDF